MRTRDAIEHPVNGGTQIVSHTFIDGSYFMHLRVQIAAVQQARDLAKIDAQISDSRAVRHHEVGGDPYQQLVQGKSLRPKRDEIAERETCQPLQLDRSGNAGEEGPTGWLW